MSKLLTALHAFLGTVPEDIADWLRLIVEAIRLGLTMRSLRKEERSKRKVFKRRKRAVKESQPKDSPKAPDSENPEGGAHV